MTEHDPRAGLGPLHPEDPGPAYPRPDAHRLTVVVAFAITPAGLASYARRQGFGADQAKALEHLQTQLPGYVDTGLYRTPELEPCVWHVTTATLASHAGGPT